MKLPCIMTPLERKDENVHHGMTRNISAGGALINAVNALLVGTRLIIQILIPSPARGDVAHSGACVRLCGEVVRADFLGNAVEFDDQYHIFQIGKMAEEDDNAQTSEPAVDFPKRKVSAVEASVSCSATGLSHWKAK